MNLKRIDLYEKFISKQKQIYISLTSGTLLINTQPKTADNYGTACNTIET